jgi:hypothetical protein
MNFWLRFVWFIGTLLRPKVFAALTGVVLIAGGAWMIAAAGGAQIQLPGIFRIVARPNPPVTDKDREEDKAAFVQMMKNQVWAEGYSPLIRKDSGPRLYYWAIFWGTREIGSHVDQDGKPFPVLCLHLYSERVRRDDVGMVAPHPYFLGLMIWPEALAKCERDQTDIKFRLRSEDAPFQQPPYQPSTGEH